VSKTSISDAIKTKMEAIDGINNVFDYVFWTDDYQVIYNYLSANGRIDSWHIGQGATTTTIDSGMKIRNYLWNIFGIYSIKTSDESSKAFELLIEKILDDFSISFSFLAQTNHTPPNLVILENGVYSNTPVHRCQIQLPVTERTAQNLQNPQGGDCGG